MDLSILRIPPFVLLSLLFFLFIQPLSAANEDISGTKVMHPDVMVIGKSYQIQDFIQNRGETAASSFLIQYGISRALSSSDALSVGTWNIDGLKSGARKTGNISITIPLNTSPGEYYILRSIDPAGTLKGQVSVNTTSFSKNPVKIIEKGVNDSGVSCIGTLVSDTIPAGGLLNLTSIFGNDGKKSSEPFTIRYYLAALDNSSRIHLGDADVPVITPGGETEVNGVFLVPEETGEGNYSLSTMASPPDAIAEHEWFYQDQITVNKPSAISSSGNHDSTSSASSARSSSSRSSSAPDIINSGVEIPEDAFIGGDFVVSDSVTNLGGAAANIVTVNFYLSPNQEGLSRRNVGSWSLFNLQPDETRTKQVSLGVPENIRSGVYFMVKEIKTTSNPPEVNTANNIWISNTPVRVRYDPSAPIPDLTHVKTTFPCGQPGATGEIVDSVTNIGNSCAGTFVVAYYLSPYDQFDAGTARLLGQWKVDGLCVGEQKTNTVKVTIPGDLTNGVYYFYAVIDPCSFITSCDEELPELDKSNNINAGRLTIGPCPLCGCS